MLTGNLLRARYARNRVLPIYLDTADAAWLDAAERLLGMYRGREGVSRGELEEEVTDAFGDEHNQLVYRGLAKLLEDRCEFEVASDHPPAELREAVFRAAAEARQALAARHEPGAHPFDRDAVLRGVAGPLGLTPEQVDRGLFADLKSEQRLIRFDDTTAERLLQRYNVALAQAVLFRATKVHVLVRGEPPARFRQLFRQVKFHRLICEVSRAGDAYSLHLDGPLSLFSATQKYGLQLALFLPAVLRCRDFELTAELAWGAGRKPKVFSLAPRDGLVSHQPDTGTYVPPELAMFADLFRRKIPDWILAEETEVFPLGDSFWVPDFRLTHRTSGAVVFLEVLGFWRKASAEAHVARLREHATEPYLLAVSDSLRIDDAALEGLPAGVVRFRQMPLPEEVARQATALALRGL